MCGILGLVTDEEKWLNVQSYKFEKALNKISHRGPDDNGKLILNLSCNKVLSFGHHRLSIFDLTERGHQPMSDSKGRAIIYNGEIFNWHELKLELIKNGYEFLTDTDTEVVLASYDYWGDDCVNMFNGFWSFAIFDPSDGSGFNKLFLSRDRVGIKPLYYYIDSGTFVFSSEISPIYQILDKKCEVNFSVLASALIYDNHDSTQESLYKNIVEARPASNYTYIIESGRILSEEYWTPTNTSTIKRTDSDALNEFKYLIEDATRLRLRSDVDVALTLSGGLDSSAVGIAVNAVSDNKVAAFTSQFEDSSIDEHIYAEKVAKEFNYRHIKITPDTVNLDNNEKNLSRHQEMLYTSLSQLVNWFVAKSMSENGIKVFLNGQGGDELFLGYERYYVPFLLYNFTKKKKIFRDFISITSNSKLSYKDLLLYLFYFSNTIIRNFQYKKRSRKYLNRDFMNLAVGGSYTLPIDLKELCVQESCGPQLRRLLRFDDRIASAFGMEGRPVFLDHRMIEFSLSLESKHKIRNGWTKFLIRKYIESEGLNDIAWRKNKLGFPAPNRLWTSKILNSRNESIKSNPVLNRILSPNVDFLSLSDLEIFKIINLDSTSRVMNWSFN